MEERDKRLLAQCSDAQLLGEYTRTRSAEALDEIVRRYGGLVYHCCLRQLNDAAAAEDVAQATFLVLLRKAQTLPQDTLLPGWLVRTATLAARDYRKLKLRRARHEREAAEMQASFTPQTTEEAWQVVRPHLDEALTELPASQRDALVLHYLQGCPREEAARRVGCPPKTFASRIALGLEKLREKLARRGIMLASTVLSAAVSERAAPAVPEQVLSSIRGACVNAGASVMAVQTAEEVLKTMFWMSVKSCALSVTAILTLALALLLALRAPAEETEPPQTQPESPLAAQAKPRQSGYSAEADALRASFAKLYAPVPLNVVPKVPQYTLPLDLTTLSNAALAQRDLKDSALKTLLIKNGFAAAAPARSDNIAEYYNDLTTQNIPVFITSDSVLHLYHIQFDETLRQIEERELSKDLLALVKALYDASIQQAQQTSAIAQRAALFNAAYFAVALECLATDTLREELEKARQLLATAQEHSGDDLLAHHYPSARHALWKYAQTLRNFRGYESNAQFLQILDALLQKTPSGPRLIKYELGAGLSAAQAADLRHTVATELALIAQHTGFMPSPLFQYHEDYSQYAPRGHYTRSQVLQRYFKALMWLGRMTALLEGGQPHGPNREYLISAESARVQTTAGTLAAELLDSTQIEDQSARQIWERIYAVTAFYVGFADDLTPFEYRQAAHKVLGARFNPEALNDDAKYLALRRELSTLRSPAIYSGTGKQQVAYAAAVPSEEDQLKALENTRGFRLLGQRYVPDSYILGTLVFPTVGPWGGGEQAFTTVKAQTGQFRGFPRGLDVMAVLGSARAERHLRESRDDNYRAAGPAKSYHDALQQLRKEFAANDQKQWNQNLYWSWCYCLQALLGAPPAGYPTFMRSEAWADKQLSAALGSWSQLRHDTILYTKQSYTKCEGAGGPSLRMVEGYVEPVPEFYARVLALTRMTRTGLFELNVVSPAELARLKALEDIMVRLLDISLKELGNEFLNKDDYQFIREFGANLGAVVAGIDTTGLATSLIADVHTDQTTQSVLEEATGNLRPLWVVYPMPDGGRVLGCGPAFSYYEFKQPMAQRLSDEAWREKLRAQQAPPLPEWTGGFGVPANKR